MSYALRRASPDDAPLLAEHRGRVWREVGDWDEEPIAAQIPIWTAWMRDAVADGTYVAWIAEDASREALASGAVLVHVAIPRPGFPSDREGRVQSVYVMPDARRRGIARAIMAEIMEYAREAMLIRLSLHPSDEARALYLALGFRKLDELGLRLTNE
jgi:ribosomal protein S18 acetylase RimI-like enzyme